MDQKSEAKTIPYNESSHNRSISDKKRHNYIMKITKLSSLKMKILKLNQIILKPKIPKRCR